MTKAFKCGFLEKCAEMHVPASVACWLLKDAQVHSYPRGVANWTYADRRRAYNNQAPGLSGNSLDSVVRAWRSNVEFPAEALSELVKSDTIAKRLRDQLYDGIGKPLQRNEPVPDELLSQAFGEEIDRVFQELLDAPDGPYLLLAEDGDTWDTLADRSGVRADLLRRANTFPGVGLSSRPEGFVRAFVYPSDFKSSGENKLFAKDMDTSLDALRPYLSPEGALRGGHGRASMIPIAALKRYVEPVYQLDASTLDDESWADFRDKAANQLGIEVGSKGTDEAIRQALGVMVNRSHGSVPGIKKDMASEQWDSSKLRQGGRAFGGDQTDGGYADVRSRISTYLDSWRNGGYTNEVAATRMLHADHGRTAVPETDRQFVRSEKVLPNADGGNRDMLVWHEMNRTEK